MANQKDCFIVKTTTEQSSHATKEFRSGSRKVLNLRTVQSSLPKYLALFDYLLKASAGLRVKARAGIST